MQLHPMTGAGMRVAAWLLLLLVLIRAPGRTDGHGRMVDPPSRSTMWRYGFKSPANYNDNQLFCGGRIVQERSGGKCGVCGDPYEGPRENEAGGRYARGIITKAYQVGGILSARIQITSNHLGWFEFKLCPQNNPFKPVTQSCLDRYTLPLAGSPSRRYQVGHQSGFITVRLQLPPYVTCTHCVLQWTYHAANSWGFDQGTHKQCLGCGSQETFRSCSDIQILTNPAKNTVGKSELPHVEDSPVDRDTPHRLQDPPQHVGSAARNAVAPSGSSGCQGTGMYKMSPGMNKWCDVNCEQGYCPASHCVCASKSSTQSGSSSGVVAVAPFRRTQFHNISPKQIPPSGASNSVVASMPYQRRYIYTPAPSPAPTPTPATRAAPPVVTMPRSTIYTRVANGANPNAFSIAYRQSSPSQRYLRQPSVMRCTKFVAKGPYANIMFVDGYCQLSCSIGKCPSYMCKCAEKRHQPYLTCRARDFRLARIPGINDYCSVACSQSSCPKGCFCDA